MSTDIKKTKPPKFFGSKSREDAEAWFSEMEHYYEIRNFLEISKVFWLIYHFTREGATWWGNTKVEKNIKTTKISWEIFVTILTNCWLSKTFYDKKLLDLQNMK